MRHFNPFVNIIAVYITIKEVWVSKEAEETADTDTEAAAEWIVVSQPNATYNLLELVNGMVQELGISELEAGKYNQIRLVLGETPDETLNIMGSPHPYANYLIYGEDADNFDYYELKIPNRICIRNQRHCL